MSDDARPLSAEVLAAIRRTAEAGLYDSMRDRVYKREISDLVLTLLDAARSPEPLNVERLARALMFQRYGIVGPTPNPVEMRDARAIAAEYARLAATAPKGGPR